MNSILRVIVAILLFALKSTIAIVVNSTHNITTQILVLKNDNEKLLKIAFGSCYGMLNFMTDIFKTIHSYDPDVWMWLGDAAYTDNMLTSYKKDNSMPLEHVRERFQMTLDDPYYKDLMNRTQIIGVWDDHDYGANNADASFEKKQIHRQVYLDFIGEPLDSLRRLETSRGIYQDYIVYHKGIKLHIVLLDVRFHYNQDAQDDRLGYQQYEWLEEIFSQNRDSDVTIIGSGVHIIPQRYLSYVEDIGENAKQKILDLVAKYEKSGVILLSGDVHWAQMFSLGCQSYTGYNIFEFCSSGLTHILTENVYEGIQYLMEGHTPNIFKESEIYMEHNYATIEVERTEDYQDIDILITIRKKDSQEIIKKRLLVNRDLKFKKDSTKYGSMCRQIHTAGKKILLFNKVTDSVVFNKDINFFAWFAGMCTIFGLLPIAIVIRLINLMNKGYLCLKKRFTKKGNVNTMSIQ